MSGLNPKSALALSLASKGNLVEYNIPQDKLLSGGILSLFVTT